MTQILMIITIAIILGFMGIILFKKFYQIQKKSNINPVSGNDDLKIIELEKQLAVMQERIINREKQIENQNNDFEKLTQKFDKSESEKKELEQNFLTINNEKKIFEEKFNAIKIEFDHQKNQLSQLNVKLQNLEKTNGELSFENKNLQEYYEILKNDIANSKQNSLTQFENLANKILEEKSQKFSESNFNNLKTILNPLGQNIDEFKKQINEVYNKEAKERFSLERVVKDLQENSNKISLEANNLTNALKGSSKKQGNWGEMILESILQQSGLIKDVHYFREKSFVNEEGKNLRPDFQILLPDNRLIITDSKVSLIGYEKYCANDNQQLQKTFIEDHLKSIYSHIDSLSSKKYDDLEQSLDFTMMFIPIEPAYLLAINFDPQLWFYAYEKRILLVSSTNMIICLKLINDLWKRESQNRNAMEIVNLAEKLYDKFVGFAENFVKIGSQIEILNKTYEASLNQLSLGRGNLISQAKKFKDLGLKSSKKIPEILTNHEDEEEFIEENLDEKNSEKILENHISTIEEK